MSDVTIGATPSTVQKIIPSYLYQEYSDDDDLQAFINAYNQIAQEYLDWFNQIGLPIYTGPLIAGALLDWVAQGIYGLLRPVLPSGLSQQIGPLNTYEYNQLTLNTRKLIGSSNYYVTTDDVFKRIITWHFFKGDGKVFNIRWLKRRIMRFLNGTNGISYNVDQTYQISVTFGVGNQVNINILNGLRRVVGGAFPNAFGFNTTRPNQLNTVFTPYAQLPLAPIFKAAVDSGVLELPFQFTYVVTI